MKKIIVFFILIFCVNLSAQKTDYSQIPKNINKQIQKFYERKNVFYFYFPEFKNSLTLWNYENGKVKWFSINKNRVTKSGEFESEINSDSLSINATNKIVKNEIAKMNEDYHCKDVLDGSFLGYVLTIDNEEIIGKNSISTFTCTENKNSQITKDFKRIFNLLYKTK